jgi:hypothetical protein
VRGGFADDLGALHRHARPAREHEVNPVAQAGRGVATAAISKRRARETGREEGWGPDPRRPAMAQFARPAERRASPGPAAPSRNSCCAKLDAPDGAIAQLPTAAAGIASLPKLRVAGPASGVILPPFKSGP